MGERRAVAAFWLGLLLACDGSDFVQRARAERADARESRAPARVAERDATLPARTELRPIASPIAEVERLPMRSSGVAPLGLVFDALDPEWAVARPEDGDIMRLDYAWDFGDRQAGTFATDGRSRNSDSGFIAAHVYERPGRYSVRLIVTDPRGHKHEYLRVVNVEPFRGRTYYVSSSGGDDSRDGQAPASAFRTLERAMSLAAPNVRIMLRRGDAWTLRDKIRLNSPGPLIIGAYGEGPRPRLQMEADEPVFDVRGRDIRIMDLAFVGPTRSTHQAIAGATEGGTQELLLLRNEMSGFHSGVAWSRWQSYRHRDVVIAECHIHDILGNGVFVGGEHLALLGNRIERPRDSHVARVWQAYRSVIAHNVLDLAGDHHALKLHGIGPEHPHRPTQFVVITGNDFRGKIWVVGIGPQNATSNEPCSDILFERNRVRSVVETTVGLLVWARRVAVRNNVFDGSGSKRGWTAILVDRRGIEDPPSEVLISNNTVVRSEGGGAELRVFNVGAAAERVQIVNNLVYAPATAPFHLFFGEGHPEVEAKNLVSRSNPFRDLRRGDLRLGEGARALSAGVAVPGLYRDFEGRVRRSRASSVGAYER